MRRWTLPNLCVLSLGEKVDYRGGSAGAVAVYKIGWVLVAF